MGWLSRDQPGSAGQTQPAGAFCLARCLFPPEETGNSCSSNVGSANSPAALPVPDQSPTQRVTSCCSGEEGARCRYMSSYISPLAGRDFLLPFQDSSWLGRPRLECSCSAPQIRPPRVGFQDLSCHNPQGIPMWRYSAVEKLPKPFEPFWVSPSLCHWLQHKSLKSLRVWCAHLFYSNWQKNSMTSSYRIMDTLRHCSQQNEIQGGRVGTFFIAGHIQPSLQSFKQTGLFLRNLQKWRKKIKTTKPVLFILNASTKENRQAHSTTG